jgi:uncharacterized membrane protein
LLFAVPVAEDFREMPEGRRAIGMFRLVVGIGIALGLVALALLPNAEDSPVAPLVLTVVAAAAYYKARRMVAPFRVTAEAKRSMEISDAPETLPRYVWWGIGPFVILAAAARYLNAHWSGIPAQFAVHIGLSGEPDRWAEKGVKSVYGGLVFGAELCAWFLVVALAAWYGSRRSSLRLTMMGFFIVVEYGMALLLAVMALQPLLAIPIWLFLLFVLAPAILLIVFAIKKASEPSDAPEKTPEECWKGGMFYFNPNDPVLFVERRVGFGYTMNFANRWTWAIMGGLVAVMASAPLVIA